MGEIGEIELYKKEIRRLKDKIKTRDDQIARTEKPNKKFENLKHELRRSCKDPKFTDLAQYQNYVYNLTWK